jgi:hypothetical protein
VRGIFVEIAREKPAPRTSIRFTSEASHELQDPGVGMRADVFCSADTRHDTRCRLPGVRGLLAGQPGYHRGQHFGGVGAKDEVGVADLLAPPLDLLGGGRWVIREYGQRVRLP